MNYPSQLGQDRFLNENYFKSKNNGIFVDVGAHNGITISNSLFFENIGWTGICVEPNPAVFNELKNNRKCICENYAISDEQGEEDFLLVTGYAEMLSGLKKEYCDMHLGRVRGEINHYGGKEEIIKVKTIRLDTLFNKHNIKYVDFLSVDTEGNELKVLKSIDYNDTKVFSISVENNYKDPSIKEFLTSVGFELIKTLEIDEIYINTKI